MYENVDMNKFYPKYELSTKDVNFNEYYDSKQLFNGIKNQHIKFDDELKKQKVLLKKVNEVKIGKKTPKQKELINNLNLFLTILEKKFLIV